MYLSILFEVLLTISCIKPTNNDPLTESSPGVKVIDKTITNAMYFKKGSYWVYESDRGEIDSMWVDSRSSINFNADSKAQEFNTYMFSSIEQNSRIVWCQIRQFDPDTQFRIQIASYFRGSASGLINADIFKPAKGTTNKCITCTGDTAILMPTYTLNGITYKNVWRLINKQYRSVYDANLESSGQYYFAEGIGIIEKEDGGLPHYFKLKRYHIVN
jgi:hypothetical protein